MHTDTIAAIATAVSDSGIGIIRISGSDALLVADKVYRSPKNQKKLSQAASHTIHYGYIYDEDELIDEVMVAVMRSPHSYTTEDTVKNRKSNRQFLMRKPIFCTHVKNRIKRPLEQIVEGNRI